MSDAADLRKHAAAIFEAALRAMDPAVRVAEALADDPMLADWAAHEALRSTGAPISPTEPAGRLVVVAVGKAAEGMTRGAVAVFGDALDEGVVVAPRDPGSGRPGRSLPAGFSQIQGGHPFPDQGSLEAGRVVRELVRDLGPADRLLVLLSGGASALMVDPVEGVSVDDLRVATRRLMDAGWPIGRLNGFRGRLDRLKAGGLAQLAAPARVLGLVLSDVAGGSLEVVGSGPLSPAPLRYRELEIDLRREGLWGELPSSLCTVIHEGTAPHPAAPSESEPAPSRNRVTLRDVGGGAEALRAAGKAARARGFETQVLSDRLQGEARVAGRGLARVGAAIQDGIGGVSLPACGLVAGETTVRVVGSGRGGRNQEVALGAALALEGRDGILVASLGTDGIDGPTDAAGAWADGQTVARARRLGWDAAKALAENDAYPFFDALGDLIRTGPTGTNVADLMLVLVSKVAPAPGPSA